MSAGANATMAQSSWPLSVPQWVAVYTSVNQEKSVAAQFQLRGIECFLPLYKTVRRRTDRRVTLDLPLFPGYLFACIPLMHRLRVLEVPRVVRIVGNHGTAAVVAEEEIRGLRNGLSIRGVVAPCQYLPKGTAVLVKNGPFAGCKGVLVRRKSGYRVMISLEVIRQAFTIEVGEEDVERVFGA